MSVDFDLVHVCASEVINRYNGGFWNRLKLRLFKFGLARSGFKMSGWGDGSLSNFSAFIVVPVRKYDTVLIDFTYWSGSEFRFDITVWDPVGGLTYLELDDPDLFDKIFEHIEKWSNNGV